MTSYSDAPRNNSRAVASSSGSSPLWKYTRIVARLHCPHHSKPLQLTDPIVLLVLLQRAAGECDRSNGLVRLYLREDSSQPDSGGICLEEELLSKLGIGQYQ